MVTSAGNTQVDCSTSTATISKGTCSARHSEGIAAAFNVTTTIDVAGCM